MVLFASHTTSLFKENAINRLKILCIGTSVEKKLKNALQVVVITKKYIWTNVN